MVDALKETEEGEILENQGAAQKAGRSHPTSNIGKDMVNVDENYDGQMIKSLKMKKKSVVNKPKSYTLVQVK